MRNMKVDFSIIKFAEVKKISSSKYKTLSLHFKLFSSEIIHNTCRRISLTRMLVTNSPVGFTEFHLQFKFSLQEQAVEANTVTGTY